jgi:Fe-S cluster assembly iron-binding protein IscA
MSITLSDSAATRVNNFLANRGKGFGLRLGSNLRLFWYGLRTGIC